MESNTIEIVESVERHTLDEGDTVTIRDTFDNIEGGKRVLVEIEGRAAPKMFKVMSDNRLIDGTRWGPRATFE